MKKKIVLILFFLSFLLTGCRIYIEKTPTPTPGTTLTPEVTPTPTPEVTPTPTPEVVLEEIYVKNPETIYVNVGEAYNPNLTIIAKYSDGTEKDISEEVSFSSINTSSAGEKKLAITYDTKKIEVTINVVSPTGITINADNAKVVYSIGDHIDLSGLVIKHQYGNNLQLDVDMYTVLITDQSGRTMTATDEFETAGKYNVNIVANGKAASYTIVVVEDSSNVQLKKVTFGYSGYQANSWEELVVSNNPEDYISAPTGYSFIGFSSEFNDWEDGDFIKIYVDEKRTNENCIVFLTEGYTRDKIEYYPRNTVINRNSINVTPTNIPTGKSFLYWDLPFSFTINEDIYTTPIFASGTVNASSFNITEEAVNNVSATAMDVNVDQFLASTPEGYYLKSITLGINGEVVEEIPYEEGMISAYFTDLTVDTEYEVGAYYRLSPALNVSARKAKQLTYDFHFVGFLIVTRGEVLYRVRMMYDGDCLYRYYFAQGTYAFSHDFFYSFALPNEYKGYTVAGSEDELGFINADKDIELILLPPAGATCTVVFYDRTYPYYLNILDIQQVPKGGSAVAPAVDEYYLNYSGTYRYNLVGWSASYTNVKGNVQTAPVYDEEPLIPPAANITAYVGDDYLIADVKMNDYLSVRTTSLYFINKTNNKKTIMAERDYIRNTRFIYKSTLAPGIEYSLVLEYFYTLNDGNGEQNVKIVYDFTTMADNASLGYKVNITNVTFDSISFTSDATAIEGYIAMPIDNNDANVLFTKSTNFYNAYQTTKYHINYYVESADNDKLYYVYSDDFEVTTGSPEMFTIYNMKFSVGEKLILKVMFNDPDKLLCSFLVEIDSPEFNKYHGAIRFWPYEPIYMDGGYYCYELSLQEPDPETGVLETYEVELLCVKVEYYKDGKYHHKFYYPLHGITDLTDGFTYLG